MAKVVAFSCPVLDEDAAAAPLGVLREEALEGQELEGDARVVEALVLDLGGGERVMQRRFNVGVPRARVRQKHR